MLGKHELNAEEKRIELLQQREEIDLLLLDNYLPDGIGNRRITRKFIADFPGTFDGHYGLLRAKGKTIC